VRYNESVVTFEQLSDAKAQAKRQFGDVPGVEGIGIGDGVLRVYVRDASVIDALPRECEEIGIDFVVTGDITASE
jgi:hypothetical protein